jgi:hypothetical protein
MRKRFNTVPDPLVTPTLRVEEAGELLDFSRSKAYAEANRYLATNGAEGLPVIRFGRTLRVPTAALLRLLGKEST